MIFSSLDFISILGIGLFFAIVLSFVIIQIVKRQTVKKRLLNGWDVQASFIIPMEEEGVSANITREFVNLFDNKDPYPFLPQESLYDATLWEEEHVELAFIELAKICKKKLPESKRSLSDMACSVVSVSDFLKAVANLPPD